jgi:putative membrane protein insertion efficiency factor
MTRLLLALLGFYKRWLSPALHSLHPGGCKFLPTCSDYAAEAIAIHGALRGSALATWRLLRCHPFTRGGFDPVPPAATRQSSPTQIHARIHPSDHRPGTVSPHEPLP